MYIFTIKGFKKFLFSIETPQLPNYENTKTLNSFNIHITCWDPWIFGLILKWHWWDSVFVNSTKVCFYLKEKRMSWKGELLFEVDFWYVLCLIFLFAFVMVHFSKNSSKTLFSHLISQKLLPFLNLTKESECKLSKRLSTIFFVMSIGAVDILCKVICLCATQGHMG